MTGTLEQLQTVTATYLANDIMFGGAQSANNKPIPIIYEVKYNVQNELQMALGKIGMCVVILTPIFKLNAPQIQSPGSLDGWAHMVITVVEDVAMNGTGIRSITAAQNILGMMHGWLHGLTASAGEAPQVRSDPSQDSIVMLGNPSESPLLKYSVPLIARLGIVRPS